MKNETITDRERVVMDYDAADLMWQKLRERERRAFARWQAARAEHDAAWAKRDAAWDAAWGSDSGLFIHASEVSNG